MTVVPFDKVKFLARKRELSHRIEYHGLKQLKAYRLKTMYGLTADQYNRMLRTQGNKCACCGGPFDMTKKRPIAVDHDHVTGKVRGLTCHGCNLMLGHAKDSEEILRRAIQYLKRSKKPFPR